MTPLPTRDAQDVLSHFAQNNHPKWALLGANTRTGDISGCHRRRVLRENHLRQSRRMFCEEKSLISTTVSKRIRGDFGRNANGAEFAVAESSCRRVAGQPWTRDHASRILPPRPMERFGQSSPRKKLPDGALLHPGAFDGNQIVSSYSPEPRGRSLVPACSNQGLSPCRYIRRRRTSCCR